VDGGDFAPDPGDTLHLETADLMIEAMALMHYGAVAVGERDLLQGRRVLERAAERLPLVCANLRLPADLRAAVPPLRWIAHRGRRVAVTGCLDPALYYEHPQAWADPGIALVDAWDQVDSVLAAVRDSADLIVVLAHAPLDAVEAWLATAPPADLVIVGHEPDVGRRRLAAPPFLLETGPRSRQVGLAVLRGTRADLRLERYRLYDLMETSGTDTRIDRMVDAFQDAHGLR
jgi:2',3'-cyclic-nucleotide 2'-phosphodiesterase (5'-nucleotidase family)